MTSESERNKQVARRYALEAFLRNDPAAWDDTVANDYVNHNPAPGQDPGRKGMERSAAVYLKAFPDMATTIDMQIANADLVAQGGVATGTNTGSLLGMPPTGKSITMPWIDIYRLRDGKIVDHWHVEDLVALSQQLGVG